MAVFNHYKVSIPEKNGHMKSLLINYFPIFYENVFPEKNDFFLPSQKSSFHKNNFWKLKNMKSY
jgi:hypothetical protein